MSDKTAEALKAAGWVSGDAEDFLELTEVERAMVDLYVSLGNAIRRIREARGMSEDDFARLLKAKKAHVAAIEIGVGVTLDEMFEALFSLGGTLASIPAGKPKIEYLGDAPIDGIESAQGNAVTNPRSRRKSG